MKLINLFVAGYLMYAFHASYVFWLAFGIVIGLVGTKDLLR